MWNRGRACVKSRVSDHANGSVRGHVNGSVRDHANGCVRALDHVNGCVRDRDHVNGCVRDRVHGCGMIDLRRVRVYERVRSQNLKTRVRDGANDTLPGQQAILRQVP